VNPSKLTPQPFKKVSVTLLRLRGWGAGVMGQKRRLATAAASVLAVAVGYHVVFGHNGLTAYRQKQQDFRNLDLQLKQLTKENEALKGHVERLADEPDAIVHQAREELHYARQGEVIVTLPPDGSPGDKPAGAVK
jgi:cell division protein FtsB